MLAKSSSFAATIPVPIGTAPTVSAAASVKQASSPRSFVDTAVTARLDHTCVTLLTPGSFPVKLGGLRENDIAWFMQRSQARTPLARLFEEIADLHGCMRPRKPRQQLSLLIAGFDESFLDVVTALHSVCDLTVDIWDGRLVDRGLAERIGSTYFGRRLDIALKNYWNVHGISARSCRSWDLAIIGADIRIDPVEYSRVEQLNIPHICVVRQRGYTLLGPVVPPTGTPCYLCVELGQAEVDPSYFQQLYLLSSHVSAPPPELAQQFRVITELTYLAHSFMRPADSPNVNEVNENSSEEPPDASPLARTSQKPRDYYEGVRPNAPFAHFPTTSEAFSTFTDSAMMTDPKALSSWIKPAVTVSTASPGHAFMTKIFSASDPPPQEGSPKTGTPLATLEVPSTSDPIAYGYAPAQGIGLRPPADVPDKDCERSATQALPSSVCLLCFPDGSIQPVLLTAHPECTCQFNCASVTA